MIFIGGILIHNISEVHFNWKIDCRSYLIIKTQISKFLAMDDKFGQCNRTDNSMNTLVLAENTIMIKEEKYEEDDFVEDKVNVSETAIIFPNTEFQDHMRHDNINHVEVSTIVDNIKREFCSSVEQQEEYNKLNFNVKIEKGINANDLKIEQDNELLYCEDCHTYYADYCNKCGMLVHILNRNVSSNANEAARNQLPNNILEIQNAFGRLGIFALNVIAECVTFGPFMGLNRSEYPWKIKGGKFVASPYNSECLNWMQYINPARNSSEGNLLISQYEDKVYYQSCRRIQEGDELLVYFGEEYEDCLNDDVEMDFNPTTEHISKDVFACTFCCLGFSSQSYLAAHKTICLEDASRTFSVKEITQCQFCKIHMHQKEYYENHMADCCKTVDRKCVPPPPPVDAILETNEHKKRRLRTHKCGQCRFRTNYKADLKSHTNQHYAVKIYKCEICGRLFKTKELFRFHVRNAHVFVGGKDDLKRTNTRLKAKHSRSQSDAKPLKCSLCEFQTKYQHCLQRHVKSKHLKEFDYKCDSCEFRSNHKDYLECHKKSKHLQHLMEYSYRCESCSYQTNRKSLLQMHTKTKHLKLFKYKCDQCGYKTNYKWNLEHHGKTRHSREFNVRCKMCDYETHVESNLEYHVKTTHLKEFAHKCGQCDYKTNRKSNFESHVRAKHRQEFNYKCETCEFRTGRRDHLEKHVRGKHLNEFNHRCELCDYKTNRRSDLNKHVKTKHLKTFNYKCERCDYKTNEKSNLESHVKAKHLKEFKYKCEECEYRAIRRDHLERHMKAKHLKELGRKPEPIRSVMMAANRSETRAKAKPHIEFSHKCDSCEYGTNRKSNLDYHTKAKHLKEFAHECQACDYKTNVRSNLRIHVKTKHLEEFNYACATCDYKTNHRSCLDLHVKSKHLREFDYRCDFCEFQTNRKIYLENHVKAKHLGEFRFNCEHCDYGANRRDQLERHVNAKHF